jgi:hypothetical protein
VAHRARGTLGFAKKVERVYHRSKSWCKIVGWLQAGHAIVGTIRAVEEDEE